MYDIIKLKWEPLFEKECWDELSHKIISATTTPGVLSKNVSEALSAMCKRIQEIESERILRSRSDRSKLDPRSQPIQDAIDKILFHCYGLTEEEGNYIEKRLGEML